MVTASGGNYVIAGQSNRPLDFKVGSTYTFDLSSSSNSSHPLRFSTTNNGTHGGGSEYTTGVTITGYQGQAGSSISIVVTEDTPSTLYYYCAYHSGMGGTLSVSSADDVSASINSFASAALNGSALITASSNATVEASVTITAVSELTAAAHAVVDVGAAFESSSNVTAEAIAIYNAQASVTGSSSLSSVSYNVSSASATFIGSSIAISVGHKKSVAHTTINANAAVSSAANSEVYNTVSVAASAVVSSIAVNYSSAQASCVAHSSVSSSAFNTANPNAAIIAHANISATTSITQFATANIDGSCVITAAPSLVIDVSASLSAFAVSISVGNKISVGHAQFIGNANLTAEAQASNIGRATITCSASVSSSAIAARIIPAEAHVSDSFEVTPGYWIPEVKEWQYQSGLEQGRTGPNGASSGSYVSGHWWTDNNGSNTSGETTDTWQLLPPYFGYIPPSAGGPVYRYSIAKYVVTTAAIWVPPVNTPTGYTPNAQVVVSNVTVLSGSFAYPSASADVIATGTRTALVSANVISAASVTATPFTFEILNAVAVVNSEASVTTNSYVNNSGSAQIIATAQVNASGITQKYATAAFSGSSVAISIGHSILVGQTAIVCSAFINTAVYLEAFSTISITSNAVINTLPTVTVYAEGAFTGSSANIANAQVIIFASEVIVASATITAEAHKEVNVTALIETTAEVTSVAIDYDLPEGHVSASAAVNAEAVVFKFASAPINISARAIISTQFVLLAQYGQRSNGILILIAAENRSIIVSDEIRTVYAQAA